ncbi:DUF2442 domain-containing protein [Thiohalocapsa sp. ML1]|jgi:hypothetical protein|uniref:DUF2442 domain-containing protein n=1 Tax=Thiohalocapsa sp. ML1 TaxID=1431688 RepID=UPI00156E4A90|nr:DUF2442 domain-containing protein [Thiohalocapsa sp. ML1]
MSVEAAAETDLALGVTPSAPWRVTEVSVLPNYRLAVTFTDGRRGIVDMSAVQTSDDCGIYARLRETELFAQAHIDLGVVTWPNGADLDPAWMYDELENGNTWSVPL